MERIISYIFFYSRFLLKRNYLAFRWRSDCNRRSLGPPLPRWKMQIAFRRAGIPQSSALLYVYFFLSGLSVRRVVASELAITRVLPFCENSVGRVRQERKHYRRLRNFPRHRARGTSCRGDKVREHRGERWRVHRGERWREHGEMEERRDTLSHAISPPVRSRQGRTRRRSSSPSSLYLSFLFDVPARSLDFHRLYRRWRLGWGDR